MVSVRKYRRVYILAVPLSIVLLAVPLWIYSGVWLTFVALAVAALCFFVISSLVRKAVKAQEQECFLDLQLIQSQKLAAIGELSAGLAHEINNPLAIMAQEAEWARHQLRGENPDEKSMGELKDSLDEIARQVDRCGEITRRVLDFARKRDPLVQRTDINKLLEDMAKLVDKEVSHKGILIVRQYRKDLPPALTDPPLLRQVVLNLLNNAAYAGGQKGTITIRTRMPENGEIEIEISDTGCGIPKENLNRIFDPFFTTKPPGKGTGLGLSLCQSIVVRLGGTITVESEPGKGTAFAVRLPLDYGSHKSG
ncbi:MAG: ATP-binding protein [Syntrophobacteraceae bacterium]|jgi:signal transduction histidine kinase